MNLNTTMSLTWRSEIWPNFACSDKWYKYDPVIIWIQQLDWSDHRLIASSPRMSVQLNNLKNSFLCCKQSQEFMLYAAKQSQKFFLSFLLVLQTISRILSCLCCKQSPPCQDYHSLPFPKNGPTTQHIWVLQVCS